MYQENLLQMNKKFNDDVLPDSSLDEFVIFRMWNIVATGFDRV